MRFIYVSCSILTLVLLTAIKADAETNLDYPQSVMLALQGSKSPKLLHMSCKPHDENRIKCRKLKVGIKEPKIVPYSKILEQIKETWEIGNTQASHREFCSDIITQFPLLDEQDIKNRLSTDQAETELDQRKLRIELGANFFFTLREACAEPVTQESVANSIFQMQKQSPVCYIDWMPDFEKIYSLDQANGQWTYRMDMKGLCGRHIITENIRPSPAKYYNHLFELEVLNVYPDFEEGSECQHGLKPEPLKKLYSPTRTKFSRACMGFVFE